MYTFIYIYASCIYILYIHIYVYVYYPNPNFISHDALRGVFVAQRHPHFSEALRWRRGGRSARSSASNPPGNAALPQV